MNHLDKKRLPTNKELSDNYDGPDDGIYYIDQRQKYGQGYEDHAVFGIRCSKCGSDKLIVGYHSYLTVCTCPNCDIVVHIHDG